MPARLGPVRLGRVAGWHTNKVQDNVGWAGSGGTLIRCRIMRAGWHTNKVSSFYSLRHSLSGALQ